MAENAKQDLTSRPLAKPLIESVDYYHRQGRWHAHLFLLMPDHWHALLSFSQDKRMSRVIGDWKRFHRLRHDLRWQENYFDHRIRDDREFLEKANYIRNNPVARKLCKNPEDWPWVYPQITICADS
jgi:putative transposase